MEGNFLIKISNAKSLEENNINMNESNIYSYTCDRNELEKTILYIEDNYSHISCYFSSKLEKFNKLINNGYILIFIKNPKVLYGIIKVESLIIKNIPEKNYLEDNYDTDTDTDTNVNVNTDDDLLIDNELIEINENLYKELIKKYKLVEVPKMFFVKFKHLYFFEYEITMGKLNNYLCSSLSTNTNTNESSQNYFKYPYKTQNKEMIKYHNKNFIVNLKNYIDYLNNSDKMTESKSKINLNLVPDVKLDLIKSNSIERSENISKQFSIPVLWNGCEIIKDMLIKSKTKHKKNIILEHYANCKECEINDNNEKILNFEGKKIVIKNISDVSSIEIFDLIIEKYSNVESIHLNDNINNFSLDIGKINIVQCSCSKSIYNQCLFIIE